MKGKLELKKKSSILKKIFDILIVSLTVLLLGFVFNFYYAVGYIFILVIHELGHYVAAKFLNLKVHFGGFTPFGAYIVHEKTKNSKDNAIVAMGGPLFGGILGIIYYIIYKITGDNNMLLLSLTSLTVNLMNLVPVNPLDGGYIAEAISPVVCYMGFPFLLYFFLSAKRLKSKILMLFLLFMGIYETYNFTKRYKTDDYFKLDKNTKIKFITAYALLVLILLGSSIYLYKSFDFKNIVISISRFK